MNVDQFVKSIINNLKNEGFSDKDLVIIVSEIRKYLSNKNKVTPQDIQFINRVIIPSIRWRGW